MENSKRDADFYFLTQLSQIRGKIRGGDSAMGVSFHHKWYQLAGSMRADISSAGAVSANLS